MERLLYILSLLRTNYWLKASDLARKCGVSERSIYRDIITISEANIPIYFDGGYKLLHKGFLPPVNLSVSEAGFLIGLLKSPLLGRGKPYHNTAKIIIDKIESGGSQVVKTKAVRIGSKFSEKEDGIKITRNIENAIRDKRIININYLSLKGEKTTRHISPYAVAFRNHAWYLIGFCHLRNEVRTFRLGRVLNVEQLSNHFELPDDFSAEEYFRSAWGVFRGKLQQFKVIFSGEAAVAVKTSKHHPDEKITELDNGDIIYEVITGGEEDFFRWVIGYGDNAEIVAPKSSREKVKQQLLNTLNKYQ